MKSLAAMVNATLDNIRAEAYARGKADGSAEYVAPESQAVTAPEPHADDRLMRHALASFVLQAARTDADVRDTVQAGVGHLEGEWDVVCLPQGTETIIRVKRTA